MLYPQFQHNCENEPPRPKYQSAFRIINHPYYTNFYQEYNPSARRHVAIKRHLLSPQLTSHVTKNRGDNNEVYMNLNAVYERKKYKRASDLAGHWQEELGKNLQN